MHYSELSSPYWMLCTHLALEAISASVVIQRSLHATVAITEPHRRDIRTFNRGKLLETSSTAMPTFDVGEIPRDAIIGCGTAVIQKSFKSTAVSRRFPSRFFEAVECTYGSDVTG